MSGTGGLTDLIGQHGKSQMAVSENCTELTSSEILRWSQEWRVERPYIATGKPMQNSFVKREAFGQLRLCWPSAGRKFQPKAFLLAGARATDVGP